ncbi:Gene 25-like lysozyme [Marinomonas spartinae]|uniref:Gene 25-like lysozyme n=1 Tax=Marinomonas spartinae TaxID=1792290 RepID=A0A1A8TIH8_9GAMM|nr:GPW/gp25 family protein [Marinomonas spartinae]SBS31962.1 Gene 25-like lysozyme [Marinomonas spartinae]
MSKRNAFLGSGWAFPPTFAPSNQRATLSQDEEDIQQSLSILLSTSPGERIMRPDYGCRLSRFVFAELNQTTLTEIEYEIRQAILLFESRIDLQEIHIQPNSEKGQLLIRIEYLIVTTNTRSNMVYPFYLQEGTLINPSLLPARDGQDA